MDQFVANLEAMVVQLATKHRIPRIVVMAPPPINPDALLLSFPAGATR
jgi:hypothetical protein